MSDYSLKKPLTFSEGYPKIFQCWNSQKGKLQINAAGFQLLTAQSECFRVGGSQSIVRDIKTMIAQKITVR